MATASEWAEFFTGDYDFYLKNEWGEWERQGPPEAGIHIRFTINGEPEDETAQVCLRATFTPRTMPNWVLTYGYFHLKRYRGTNHISGDKHPGNWHGNSLAAPDLYLNGGVIEGPSGRGGKYYRFGLFEATENGDDTFYPSEIPVRIKFQGESYKPVYSLFSEVQLLSTWRKHRPEADYPWNVL